jgi:hypothetical protein
MKMKKLLALLVMAVLSISAASATMPDWVEKMGAGEQLTIGSYSTISAYVDAGPGFDSKTAQTQYVVKQEYNGANPSNVISMDNTIKTLAVGNQESAVVRQLLLQSGKGTVYVGPAPTYDAENLKCAVTEVESFEQEQVALFSGDLDCATKSFGATFTNNNVIGNYNLPGNELHQTSADGAAEALVEGYGDGLHIIEAYAGQTTSGSLVETTCTKVDDDDHLVKSVTMSGAASLYAGFDNAIVPETTANVPNTITIKLNNGAGDKFWWDDWT